MKFEPTTEQNKKKLNENSVKLMQKKNETFCVEQKQKKSKN